MPGGTLENETTQGGSTLQNQITPLPVLPTNSLLNVYSGGIIVGGIPFRYLCRAGDLKESWTADSSSTGAVVECYYAHQTKLKFSLMGSVGSYNSQQLFRFIPYRHPLYANQYLLRMDLDGYQAAQPPGPSNIFGDPQTGFPVFAGGYAQYRIQWWNPPYMVLTDQQVSLSDPACPAELQRFVRDTKRYIPQSQKVPSAGFEFDSGGGNWVPVLEVSARPTFQTEIIAQATFWPYPAYPDTAIQNCLGKVNSVPIRIGSTGVDLAVTGLATGGTVYQPGSLLYKGPASEVTKYFYLDGAAYVDIPHLFGFRPGGGWNYVQRNDGTFAPLRVKGTVATPPFLSADLTTLFLPGP